MWLPVTASRHAGLDPASSLKRDASQPLINPDSDKNFGNEYSGAGVSACDWLWMFLQRLSMAGRDAHPTVVNLSPYLKTPISAA